MKAGVTESKSGMSHAVQFKPPLKPHRRWLIGLSIIFGIWVIFLLVLYFKTTFPLRH